MTKLLAPTALLLMLTLSACAGGGGSGNHTTTVHKVLSAAGDHRLQSLRNALPAGFEATGEKATVHGAAQELAIAPADGLEERSLHPAPTPNGEALTRALASVVNEPVPLVARPIFLTSAQVRPGQRIGVAAAHLGAGVPHAALFILQGPGFRAEHLVQVKDMVSAAYLTMPTQMKPGHWYVAAEDNSVVHADASGALAGTAMVDIGELTLTKG